jgi:hypothetical protein
MNFPSSGYGYQSQYYDEEILLNGTYEVITVTLDKDSRDTGNTNPYVLRKGLLLAKRSDGKYEPLSTADGYLNGDTPTQFMYDVVVLGYEFEVNVYEVKGVRTEVDPADRIVPVYWSCNLLSASCFYNNKTTTEITAAQFALMAGRITIVPSTVKKYTAQSGLIRNLAGIQRLELI